MSTFDFSNTFVAVAPGASDIYKVEIVTTEQTQTQKGSDRLRFQARIIEGARTGMEQENCTIRDGFNLPNSGDANMDSMMARMWMSFFISVGYDQEDIRTKGFDFDKVNDGKAFENLIGRTGYVKFVPADPENGSRYAKTNWLSAKQWAAACSAQESVAAASSSNDDDPLAKMLNG